MFIHINIQSMIWRKVKKNFEDYAFNISVQNWNTNDI